ncbi:GNAT family N-acetyltransferase [Janthinobacterium sp. FT14W]|uniref:GNAT family N-acetyltransferase n=1 Tax=Janthinobacterium sp. FT14W TaxID=2654253 RepID=UPI001264E48D|nr:GNAT family N-acetyltransferase [Janthinobacterium sp. FT14W]KAB8060223.1 GNAT family N-acetyltransferase [Janthinobacterium sp. FT14W]
MSISLRAVTADNFDVISELPLLPQQRDYLASNDYSIAQASFYPATMHTRAVYCDEEVIGFLMFVSPDDEDPSGHYRIWRFMVDHRRQGQGHGRAALGLALAEIRARPDARSIEICYKPGNTNAQRFYASMGFVETGMDADGCDMLTVIDIA